MPISVHDDAVAAMLIDEIDTAAPLLPALLVSTSHETEKSLQ
jgi:hypothetical protein